MRPWIRPACRVAYGIGVAGLGALALRAGSLAAVFQPVPKWMPFRHGLAYASGAALVVGGLALLARPATRLAALLLTLNFLVVWFLLANVPTTVAHPTTVGAWEGCGLNMAVLAGGWLFLALAHPLPAGRAAHLLGERGVSLARRLFGLGLPLVGLAHFANASEATGYVPAWFPLRIDWVYLTGAGHVAAGLAIVLGVLPRLAAVLEAAQITAFVFLAHVPAVWRAPDDRSQWAELLYAVAIAASGWLVATSFGSASPGRERASSRARRPSSRRKRTSWTRGSAIERRKSSIERR